MLREKAIQRGTPIPDIKRAEVSLSSGGVHPPCARQVMKASASRKSAGRGFQRGETDEEEWGSVTNVTSIIDRIEMHIQKSQPET